ncbi:bifunctional Calcineurin-like phosphoesterase domain [Babesia duncani]|uniref:Bifunctional Calcineurin-like phosphoesterase domain n=1 Tax=Babesia duncani TaxID=323732 RepID=A0AAD9PKT6_9APIC|nr:bifunctional Calcineurin-like phosphoesterase domain [Babesia duncani]
MTPRLTSFKAIWNKVKLSNDIENSSSPVTSVLPRKNPLVVSSTNINSLNPQTNESLNLLFNRQVIRPRATSQMPSDSTETADNEYLTESIKNISIDEEMSSPVEENVHAPDDNVQVEDPSQEMRTEFPKDDASSTNCNLTVESLGNYVTSNIKHEDGHVVFRALIATDTHLGYKSHDQHRNADAINAFEEVLYLAKHLDVDAIFHSGDLFDDTHPPRGTIYRTMELLVEYCTREIPAIEPVQIDLGNLNTQKANSSKQLLLNSSKGYDLNSSIIVDYNGRIPFFVIHGNHDNPTEPGGLSPIDLINVANLVTYLGRVTSMDSITLEPVLLKKGPIRIALYGLGWIQDERLHNTFKSGNVNFILPEDHESYYKILLFHQNRVQRKGKSSTDYIPESFLPDWLDLVIWGHEHESMRFPRDVEGCNFKIYQGGSSIQTSMILAEAVPKHVCMLEITGDSVRFYPISLETPRTLYYSELNLLYDSVTSEAEMMSKIKDEIEALLSQKQLEKTDLRFTTIFKAVDSMSNFKSTRLGQAVLNAASRPLVRIRVNYNGPHTISPRVLAANFLGIPSFLLHFKIDRVANPNDLVLFKALRRSCKNKNDTNSINGNFNIDPLLGNLSQEFGGTSNFTVKDIIFQEISKNVQCKLLLEDGLNEAIQRFAVGGVCFLILFVKAQETHAIQDYLQYQLKHVTEYLLKQHLDHISNLETAESRMEAIQQAIIGITHRMRTASLLSQNTIHTESESQIYQNQELNHINSNENETMSQKEIPNAFDILMPSNKNELTNSKRYRGNPSTPRSRKLLLIPQQYKSPKTKTPTFSDRTLPMFLKR